MEKIVKASIQVMMSAILMTRFLGPWYHQFSLQKCLGFNFLCTNIVWKKVSQVYKKPCRHFKNKLIRDWSIARTHHKCFENAEDCVEFKAEESGLDVAQWWTLWSEQCTKLPHTMLACTYNPISDRWIPAELPLSLWTALLLSLWTAWLLSLWTAWPLNLWWLT